MICNDDLWLERIYIKKDIWLCKNGVFIVCILKVLFILFKRILLIIFVNKVWIYNVNMKEIDSK